MWLAIGAVAGLLAVGCGAQQEFKARPGAGCAGVKTCSVLFVGNSYTSANTLPALFADVAASGGRSIEVTAVAVNNSTLADHLARQAVRDALRSRTINVVVLQEQSQIPAVESMRQATMYPAARALASIVRSVGALPILASTWAHARGWPEQGLNGYDAMQSALDEGYRRLGDELHAPVAVIGAAWRRALKASPGVPLWQSDGSHPTLAGSYLAAAVLYDTVFNASSVGLDAPDDLPEGTARALQLSAQSVRSAHETDP